MGSTISMRYDPEEDRLLLHVSHSAMAHPEGDTPEKVHGLWLTRRLCEAWRRDLQTMLELSAPLPERLDPAAKAVVAQAHHQAMSSQVPLQTERQGRLEAARAEAPSLVTRIKSGRRPDNAWVLHFERRDGPPVMLNLGDAALHAMVDALTSRVKLAQWSLEAMPVEKVVAVQPPAGSGLH